MNKINNIITFLILGIWMTIVISCDDSNDWSPGAQVSSDSPGVYFDRNTVRVFELEANEQMTLDQDYFTISLGRDKTKTSSALQVPIKIRYAESNLQISQTVEFAAGSARTELKIQVKDFKFGVSYLFSVEIDENFANPYKIFEDDEDGGSSRIDAQVEVLSIVAKATFTPKDYSGDKVPGFIPFEQKIYDNFDGTYSIKNFLNNNSGYALTFTLDEENNIRPVSSNGFHEDAEARWYFYSANSSESKNRIPCYLPGENSADYITYIYFYTAENTTSYQDFWIDLTSKTGRMMGYSRYSVSSSGRIAFDISWK